MQPLPPIATRNGRWVLPMADHSAMALIHLILDPGPASLRKLVRSLRNDPPLVVWALGQCGQYGQTLPEGVGQLGRWMAANLGELFDSAQFGLGHSSGSEHARQAIGKTPATGESLAELQSRYVARIAQRVELALLASELAGRHWPRLAAQAYLFALAGGGDQWEDWSTGLPAPIAGECLPPFSRSSHEDTADRPINIARKASAPSKHEPSGQSAEPGGWSLPENEGEDRQNLLGTSGFAAQAEQCVSQAKALLEQAAAANPADGHPRWRDVAQRARAAAQRWTRCISAASLLPALVAQWNRLRGLEHRHQQLLEREKLAALAEFAAGAGHEINNPLAIIAGRAQLLLKEETDPERRRELAVISAQVKRAHEMIADIRLFARPSEPEPRWFDLVSLVDQVLADLEAEAAQRAIALERVCGPGPLELQADPAQMYVAIHAVCRNAIEAIGRQGRVEVSVHCRGQTAVVQVADSGPGIGPTERRHLFDPFFSARQAGRGLGFGLSKCWRIVTDHGGQIRVESRPGQGATFQIELPLLFASPSRR